MKTITILVAATSALAAASMANAGVLLYLNETNTTLEADYAVLQFPPSITIPVGSNTGSIYGRVYEASYAPAATSPAGQNPNIIAQLGVGPFGSNPLINDAGWSWSSASYNVQVGNNDEYQLSLTPAVVGTFAYTYRFTFDGGQSWTLADLNGAGSNAGLTFESSQLGTLTVTPTPGAAIVFGAAGLAGALRRRR